MKHSTIIDIAKRLEISPSTVSRALSNHPGIKQETKDRIRKIAKEMDYAPNPIARSLKSNKTTTLGVIVPEIKHDFFSSAISGIEDLAHHAGYTIIVCQSNESYEREIMNTEMLVKQRIAGMIVSISQNTKTGDHFQDLLKQKVPLVFFDRVCEDVNASKVVIDDYRSAFEATTYLIDKGYSNIVHFAGPQVLNICTNRKKGYIKALEQKHLLKSAQFIRYGGLHEQDGYNLMDSLLKESNIPDAIFAVNDPVAIGAFQRIKEAGLRIPYDVALLGFSNNKITCLVDPPITTVDQPSFEMGKIAASLLIDTIGQKVIEPVTIVLNSKLIIRAST